MMINNKLFQLLFLSAAIIVINACGSGDGDGGNGATPVLTYSGSTSPADVSLANAQEFAAGLSNSTTSTVDQTEMEQIFYGLISAINNATSNVISGPCGGSVTVPEDPNQLIGEMKFSKFCVGTAQDDPMAFLLTGTAHYESNQSQTSLVVDLNKLQVTHMGQTFTLNAHVSYDTSISFSLATDFMGPDGKIYRIENLNISSAGSGVSINSGRFYHPEQGYVDIHTTTPLYANCSDGKPSAGVMVIEGANNSGAIIDYTSCSGYQVCSLDSTTCTPYTW